MNNVAGVKSNVLQENKLGYKLEIGKSTFRDRILENCIYVDKTQYIYELINRDSNCFLSRPRRFGKSLLVSTFKELFSSSKDLFKNCWIYDKIEWEAYPILHLDFIKVDYKTFGLVRAIDKQLNGLAEQFGIKLTGESIKEKFNELIETLAKTKKVVVLIDEFDKPIIDYMKDIPQAIENRDILKDFYSILKAHNSNLKFLFITGVSKFSRVSIFSDLNHLKDITIHPRYSSMLGYTQEEIEFNFASYIEEWVINTGLARQILFEKLKDYYDGYSWDGINFVYNPFSILNFFDTYRFDNYWFATGTPTFLVDIIKNTVVLVGQYDYMRVSGTFFEKYDIENIGKDNISSLLFQTGYITIKNVIKNNYVLSYPNREVKTSFLQCLLEGFSNKPEYETNTITSKIKQSLTNNRLDEFIDNLRILLSSIPYNIQIKNREAYYHSLIYIALQLSMIDVRAEVQTALGRSDIVINMDQFIYIMEFKRSNAKSALDQILEKQYYAPYVGRNKKIILLGIELNETDRNVGDWIAFDIESNQIISQSENSEKKSAIEKGASVLKNNNFKLIKKEEKRIMAIQMLKDNIPIKLISKYSGLSEKEIKKLQE